MVNRSWLINCFLAFLLTIISYQLTVNPVMAHAFGSSYILPIPVTLYLWGGAAAVILSFVLVGLFINKSNLPKYPRLNYKFQIPNSKPISWISLGLFLLTISTGLFGKNDSYFNFNMTFFWIFFLLGLTYLTALLGNVWEIINPFQTIISFTEKIFQTQLNGLIPYPKKLTYFPALIFYFLLIWTELISTVTPFTLSIRIIIYSIFILLSAILFGKVNTFKYIDFLSVFFKNISFISPLKKGRLTLPFVGLLDQSAESLPQVLFILFMLSSTAFDGFRSTSFWFNFEFQHLSKIEEALGRIGYPLIETLALLLALLLFFLLYTLLTFLIKLITQTKTHLIELLKAFAPSLIPIALAYNIAHYYTLLLIDGQLIISLISDPFGVGWNLFNTISFTPNIALISQKFIWNSQVFFILLGHIVAIYLSHIIALKVLPKKNLLSQIPMLILMVCYTVAGLWILSQPITGN